MPNKNPSPKTRFKGDASVSGLPPISFKIDDPYYSYLQNLPTNRSEYIRAAVIERIELEERAFLVELSKDDREAFKLWCQVNGHEMTSYVRLLIEEPIKEGRAMMESLRADKDK